MELNPKPTPCSVEDAKAYFQKYPGVVMSIETDKGTLRSDGTFVENSDSGFVSGATIEAPAETSNRAAEKIVQQTPQIPAEDLVSIDEAKFMFRNHPGLASVHTTEGVLHVDGRLTKFIVADEKTGAGDQVQVGTIAMV